MVYFGYHLVKAHVQTVQNMYGKGGQRVSKAELRPPENDPYFEEKKINNDKVIQCLKHANLFEFVSDLKDGINTSVGEFGDRLSGGQKQRIGIARAFYKDPEILILDEFTSSLDIDTEKKIIDELNSSKLKKTIFMISHNPNVLKNCEKLYKLTNNGISSEIGNL